MKVRKIKANNGLEFFVRPNTSDEKSVVEVVNNDTYQKRGLKILQGENWVDLGGNIGAFSVFAASLGANVETFEPDPTNYALLCKNMELNGFPTDKIHNSAVVAGTNKKAYLHLSKTGQFWRNSLEHSWGGEVLEVECVNFADAVKPGDCIKMDIEGSEMPILENWNIPNVPKMVFEWSFDIDPDLDRYRKAVKGLEDYFSKVYARNYNENYKIFPKNWFPACTNVFCFNEKD